MKAGFVKKAAALVAALAGTLCACADEVISADSVEATTGTLAANGDNWTASSLQYIAPLSNDSFNRSETGWYAGIRRTWALSSTGSGLGKKYTGTKANSVKASYSDNAGRTIAEYNVYNSLGTTEQSRDGSGIRNGTQLGGVALYMKTTDWNVWVTPETMHALAQEGKDYVATLTIGGCTNTITVPQTVVLTDDDGVQWYPAIAVVDGKVYGNMGKAVEAALVAATAGKDMEFYVEPTGYPSNASVEKDGDVWKIVMTAPTSIEAADVALSATEVVVRDADIEIEIDGVTLGAATLVKDVDYMIDEASVLKAKAVGEYTVTINGIGGYTGSASAIWKIVAPTGEFAEDAMRVKKGDPAYGRIAPETPRRLDITNTVALVYRNDERGERWEAAVDIRWPHEETAFETVLFQQVATSVRYTDAKHAAVAVGDESVAYGDEILDGEWNWLSATTGSASYYEINGLTSIKKFDYEYFDTLTWTVPIYAADVVAAIESGAKHMEFSITCGSVAWGDGTEGDIYGVKDTVFTVSLSLAKVFLLDDSGNQVYPQHTHDWRYSLSEDGMSLSAKCAADGCFLAADGGDFAVSIASKDATIPEYAEGHYRDGKPAEAFLMGAEEFSRTGAVIGDVRYMDANGGELAGAPVEPGVYSACATVTAAGGQGESGTWALRIGGLEILVGEAVVDGVHVKDAATYLERATGDDMEIVAGKSYTAARTYVIPKKYGTLSLLNCGGKTYDLAGFAVTAAADCPLFENNGRLVIKDSGEGGTISANAASADDVVIVNTGTLVIEGGTFVGSIRNDGGTVSITGGRFSVKPDESFVGDGFDLIKRSGYWCVEKHEHKYVVRSVADRFLVAACMNVLADGTLQISHCPGRMLIGVVGIRKFGLLPQLSVDYDRKEHPAEFYAINLTGVAELLTTDGLLDMVKTIIESDPATLDSDGLTGLLTALAQNADLGELLGKVGNVFVSESQFEEMTGATVGEIYYFVDGELIEGKPVEAGRYTAALEVEVADGDKLTLLGTYRINEKELPIETEGHSVHVWTFNADGAKVTATCPGNLLMGISCNASPMGLELVPSVEGGRKVYDAKPLEVTVSNLNTFVINTDAEVSEVVYVAADGTESSTAPVEPGEYTAKVEVASGTLIGALVKHTATLPLTIEEKKPEGRFTVDGWTRHVGTGTDTLTVIDGVLYYPVELGWPYSLEQILFTPRFTDPAHAEVRISSVRRTFSGEELISGEGEPWALTAEAGEFFRIKRFSNQTYMKSVTWLVPFTFEEIDEARAAGETGIVRTITLEGKCWENDLTGLMATTYTVVLDIADLVVYDSEGNQIYPVHNHAWVAESTASTLTLVCGASGCPQAPGLVAELSVGFESKTYDSQAVEASLTGADAMRQHASVEFGDIAYVQIGEGEVESPLGASAPSAPGRYRAKVDYSDGGDISGTLSAEFEILPVDISGLTASFSDSGMEFVYSGEEIGPALTGVWNGLVQLEQGTDFTIEGDSKCVEAGDYSFSIVGIGNYTGRLDFSWKIVEPAPGPGPGPGPGPEPDPEPPKSLVVAEFVDVEVSACEGEALEVVVTGGNTNRPASVKVYLSYLAAVAADIDLRNATVNGETVKGGLKFPLTLAWDTGDTEPKTISIPVKEDRIVEDGETLLFQLADAVGQEVGEDSLCHATIFDANAKTLKAAVTPYRPKKGEAVETNNVTVTGTEGGFVAGTGAYVAGTKLTLTAEARPGWTFVGWASGTGGSPLQEGDILSAKAKWQIVVTNDAEYCAFFERQPYICGVADPADGGKVTGSGYCPAGKRVMLRATANREFRFVGWIDGDGNAVTTTPSLVVDRTARPMANSKTSTTLTNVIETTSYFAVFEGNPRVTATSVALTASGVPVASEGGKVTGVAHYAPGKKVTLRATANQGFAFSGWYVTGKREEGRGNSDKDVLLSQQASFSFVMGDEDIDLYARFVTLEEDNGSITLALDDEEMVAAVAEQPPYQTNVWAGVYLKWSLAAEALSQPTVKVTGLPAGLKFTATDIMKKGSKTEVEIPANTIYGTPTAASKTDKEGKVTPSAVKVTVTTAGKSTETYTIALTVDPLPKWAVGTFYGGVEAGSGTITVAATGKISGRLNVGAETVTISAANFDGYYPDSEYMDAESGAFLATVTCKSGKESRTLPLRLIEHSLDGFKIGVAVLDDSEPFLFFRADWKSEPWKTAAAPFLKAGLCEYNAKDSEDNPGTVTLKFASSGAVTASGVFVTGKDAKDNDIVYKASATTTLIPTSEIDADTGEFTACAYVNFPPKAGKFAGYSERIELRWTGTNFVPGGQD